MYLWLFPFGEVKKDAKIVIYGHGAVGRQYINQVLASDYCEILFAVDVNYEKIKPEKVVILSPNTLATRNDYDYVVVANRSTVVSRQIIDFLHTLGVRPDRIVSRNIEIHMEEREKEFCRCDPSNWSLMKNLLYSIDSCTRNIFMGDRALQTRRYQMFSKLRTLLKCRSINDDNIKYCRLGKENDGGYYMVDCFKGVTKAYSFGISNDVSWDKCIASRNIDIFMYDHTIPCLPEENEKFHWHKVGLASSATSQGRSLKTLEQIVIENGHTDDDNMILKMDVEGVELEGLYTTPQTVLEQFSQIVIEIHYFTDERFFESLSKMLEKMNETHQVIHVHANNYGNAFYSGDIVFTDAIEVTYVRKKDYKFKSYELDNWMDQPCYNGRDEIELF